MRQIMLLIGFFCLPSAHAVNLSPKVSSHVLKIVLSGMGAVKLIEEGTRYDAAKKQIEELSELKGYDSKAAIYSVDFELEPKQSAVYWADIVGNPDVYVVIEIEGFGTILVPSLQSGYTGGKILKTVAGGNVRPGSKIRLYFLDDDMLSDTVWNSILQTKVEWFLGAEGKKAEISDHITKGLRVGASAGGKINILEHHVEIDQPDLIASAEFDAPKGAAWKLSGTIFDANNTKVGTLTFSKVDEIAVPIFGSIFYYGAALVLGLVSIKYFFAWKTS